MASITIRNLDDGLKRRLRVRAAENGRSMEEEARDILRRTVGEASSSSFPSAVRCGRRPTSGERTAMIVVDTNMVSELMRLTPEPAVMAWFSGQDSADLYLTAVSEAELRAGVAILPGGRRRERLATEIDAVIEQDFAARVLPFDSAAAAGNR